MLAIATLAGFALLSARVRAFWARVRQGLTILFDRRRYFREVWLVQFAGWGFRFSRVLDAARGVRRRRLGAQRPARPGRQRGRRAGAVHPGGAGVQQALLAKVFAGTAAGATVAAYSVGQQIAIAALTFGIGFAAIFYIFRFRSFKEVIARGRASREEEEEERTPV